MSEVIGWGVGVVLVGCLRTPHHAQTPVYKGPPRDFGGMVGCFSKKNALIMQNRVRIIIRVFIQNLRRNSSRRGNSDFTRHKLRLYSG